MCLEDYIPNEGGFLIRNIRSCLYGREEIMFYTAVDFLQQSTLGVAHCSLVRIGNGILGKMVWSRKAVLAQGSSML